MNEAMIYRKLGRSGTKVSLFGLGGWTTYGDSVADQSQVASIMKRAFDEGVNFFDSADIYNRGETEKSMGKVLAEFPRHELVISSKVFWPMSDDVNDRGLSRKHIMESIDKSLMRMGLDYLDIYFCHRYDEDTPLLETIRAMDDLVKSGKILYWGTSEWSSLQLSQAHQICKDGGYYPPQVEQPQYNLLVRKAVDESVGPVASDNGMGLVTWSPLASGVLTGKYNEGIPSDSRLSRMEWLKEKFISEENLTRVQKMGELAKSLDCSQAQLALAWAASNDKVSSVILGATKMSQLEDNLGALKIQLDESTLNELDRLFPAEGSK